MLLWYRQQEQMIQQTFIAVWGENVECGHKMLTQFRNSPKGPCVVLARTPKPELGENCMHLISAISFRH